MISGTIILDEKFKSGTFKTLKGETIQIKKTGSGLKIIGPTSTVNVLKPRIAGDNGVLRSIDNVIL